MVSASVPAVTVVGALKSLAAERVSAEPVLFWVTPVTVYPILELMSVLPVLVPELVIVPTMFTPPEIVIPLVIALLFLRIRFPMP